MRALPSAGLVVSGVTFAIGFFFFALPERAARLWGQRLLAGASNGTMYRRLYQAVGVLLCAAAILIAMDALLYDPPPPPARKVPPPNPVTRLTAPASVTNVKVCA
jgi:hypothetical protein